MSITIAADIIDTARRVYLNDPNATEVVDDRILPYLKEAYRFLQSELEAYSVPCKNEEIILPVLANTSELLNIPENMVVPNTMFERMPNTTDSFIPMTYRMNIPELPSGPYLRYWSYRLDRIYVLAATQNREVKLYYQKSFPAIETKDDSLYGKAESYLAAKTAALYNLFVRQSTTLASVCNDIAEKELDDIVSIQVKTTQSQVIRRKGYVPGLTS